MSRTSLLLYVLTERYFDQRRASFSHSSRMKLHDMNVDGDNLSLTSFAPSIDNQGGASGVLVTFRQASSYYVTHRLCEAIAVLEQLLFPADPAKDTGAGHELQGRDVIATIPRKPRIKIWSLYITVLDAAIKLGSDGAKDAVGFQRWQELTSKVRDGQIWDDVVQRGYTGNDAAVDPDVVLNLCVLPGSSLFGESYLT